MAGREVQVRLFRDALSTPWGFRLTGGKDLHTSLVVQRVAVGSPVDGELHRGDIILEIQNQNATQMTHRQAQDAIRNAGGSLVLRIKRPYGQQYSESQVPLPAPIAYDYQPPHRGFMLGRLQETLSNVIGHNPNLSDYGYYNNSTPPPPPANTVHYPTWTRSAPRQRPPTITDLMEPGWTPQCLLDQQRQGRRPQTAAAPVQPRNVSASRAGRTPAYGVVEESEAPAWLGSLRPSVESKPSDQRVAGFQPSREDGQQYQTASRGGGPAVIALPEGAQHLQYNSPLALYNKASVQQAIAGQFPGVGGNADATNGILKSSDSEVYRLVHENERQTHRREATAVAKASVHLNPQPASADSIRQSPSLHLLESQLLQGNNDAEVGITDF